MTTVEVLISLRQLDYPTYKYCLTAHDIPFTLRAQVVNKYRRQLRNWERLADG